MSVCCPAEAEAAGSARQEKQVTATTKAAKPTLAMSMLVLLRTARDCARFMAKATYRRRDGGESSQRRGAPPKAVRAQCKKKQ